MANNELDYISQIVKELRMFHHDKAAWLIEVQQIEIERLLALGDALASDYVELAASVATDALHAWKEARRG